MFTAAGSFPVDVIDKYYHYDYDKYPSTAKSGKAWGGCLPGNDVECLYHPVIIDFTYNKYIG